MPAAWRPVAVGHTSRGIICWPANLAWAYSVAGDSRQALACVGRARDEYGRSEADDNVPPWIAFFDAAELQALRGMTLATLPEPNPAQRAGGLQRFSVGPAQKESNA